MRAASPCLVEGYASLFGVEDLEGDVVRAGAFATSLVSSSGRRIPMLLQHETGHLAGYWTRIEEDSKGLKVRGLVNPDTGPSGQAALKLIQNGQLNGLSIGFIARDWSHRTPRGRLLKNIELREVSLVTSPMLPAARFTVSGAAATDQPIKQARALVPA